jgi:hypothetical protein
MVRTKCTDCALDKDEAEQDDRAQVNHNESHVLFQCFRSSLKLQSRTSAYFSHVFWIKSALIKPHAVSSCSISVTPLWRSCTLQPQFCGGISKPGWYKALVSFRESLVPEPKTNSIRTFPTDVSLHGMAISVKSFAHGTGIH